MKKRHKTSSRLLRMGGTLGVALVLLTRPASAVDPKPLSRQEREYQTRLSEVQAIRSAISREPRSNNDNLREIDATLQRAAEHAGAGEYVTASSLLNQGYESLKNAFVGLRNTTGQIKATASESAPRTAATTPDNGDIRARFSQRESSVMALHSAYQAMLIEKPEHRQRLVAANKTIAEAHQLAKDGQYPSAITTLDRAYLALKLGITEIRGGQEIKASKDFATAADEYRYERERNDDYAQLIGGLIDRSPQAAWSENRQLSLRKRQTADQAAQNGDWAQALERIGESTVELKKILRSAGFPIM